MAVSMNSPRWSLHNSVSHCPKSSDTTVADLLRYYTDVSPSSPTAEFSFPELSTTPLVSATKHRTVEASLLHLSDPTSTRCKYNTFPPIACGSEQAQAEQRGSLKARRAKTTRFSQQRFQDVVPPPANTIGKDRATLQQPAGTSLPFSSSVNGPLAPQPRQPEVTRHVKSTRKERLSLRIVPPTPDMSAVAQNVSAHRPSSSVDLSEPFNARTNERLTDRNKTRKDGDTPASLVPDENDQRSPCQSPEDRVLRSGWDDDSDEEDAAPLFRRSTRMFRSRASSDGTEKGSSKPRRPQEEGGRGWKCWLCF